MSGAIYADGPSVYNYAGFCPAGGVHNNAGSGEYSLATGPPRPAHLEVVQPVHGPLLQRKRPWRLPAGQCPEIRDSIPLA
jgi:hypothetical protein